MRPLILILPKMSGYVKTLKDQGGNKSTYNKLMSLNTNDGKLSEKHETIQTKIEDLKNIELDALPVYDCGFIKTNIRIHGDNVSTKFRGLNVPEDNVKMRIFYISIDSLLVYKSKYYLRRKQR